LPAIELIAAHCEPYSPACSSTIRTARARTSGEYRSPVPLSVHRSILSRFGASGKPGAVQLINNTSIDGLLGTKVGEHLRRYRGEHQANEQSTEWALLRHLLPEALDPVLREELAYLDALPDWARRK